MRKKRILIFLLFLHLLFLPVFLSLKGSQRVSFDGEKLPWPHQRPGMTQEEIKELAKNTWIYDNFGSYHGVEDLNFLYFHDGLDIMLHNGTKIYAIKSGHVKSARNDGCINIGDTPGTSPGWGWEYAHVINFQVEEGEYVLRGDYIADVTMNHIHLSRIHVPDGDWENKKNREYHHPNQYFTYDDTIPPEIIIPFYYFRNNSDEAFEDGSPPVVRGEVDIVVPMRDSSEAALNGPIHYPWSIARIEYEILGEHTVQPVYVKSFDFTKMYFADWPGRMYEQYTLAVYKPHYLPAIQERGWDGLYLFYNITNTDGSEELGKVEYSWDQYSWDTMALDEFGSRLFPDGRYTIKVTAYDFKGNSATAMDTVEVRNIKKGIIRR